MELILMSLLTTAAIFVGIAVGRLWGEDIGYEVGHSVGYDEGFTDGSSESNNIEDFPRSLDGKFYSREMAIKQLSRKEGDI